MGISLQARNLNAPALTHNSTTIAPSFSTMLAAGHLSCCVSSQLALNVFLLQKHFVLLGVLHRLLLAFARCKNSLKNKNISVSVESFLQELLKLAKIKSRVSLEAHRLSQDVVDNVKHVVAEKDVAGWRGSIA